MGALAQSEPTPGRRYTCKLADILASVDDEDREAIQRHLDDPAKSGHSIAAWLTRNGLQITYHPLIKHRDHLCACWRSKP